MSQSNPEPQETDNTSDKAPGVANGDRWVALILLPICAGLYYETFFFKTFDWDPVGMAFWPRVLLAVLAGVCVWHIIKGSVDGKPAERPSPSAFLWLGGAFVYIAALGFLGFYVATLLAVTIYSVLLRDITPRTILSGALLAVACVILVHLIFVTAMGVRLPLGIWG